MVSSHTAFVAIDESNQPVKGAMKTWDLTAKTMGVQAVGCHKRLPLKAARKSSGGMAPELFQASVTFAPLFKVKKRSGDDEYGTENMERKK